MERAVAGPQDTGGKRGCQESAGGAHRLDPTEGPEGSVPRAVLGPSPRPAPDLTKDPWKSVRVRQLVGFLRRPPLQGPGCPRGSDRTGARPEKSDQERLLGARRPSPQQTGQARIHAVPWDGESREGGHSRAGAEHGAQRGHFCQNLSGPWCAEAVGLSFLIWRPEGDGGGGRGPCQHRVVIRDNGEDCHLCGPSQVRATPTHDLVHLHSNPGQHASRGNFGATLPAAHRTMVPTSV